MAVRVEDDGTGTASVFFAFEESLLELLASFDEGESGGGSGDTEEFDPTSIFDGIDRSKVPDAEVEPYREGDFVGARVTAPFQDVAEIPELLDHLASGLVFPGDEPSTDAGDSDSGLERFSIERDGDGWRLDAVLEAAQTAEEAAESDGAAGDFGAQLLEDASFRIKVTLPGKLEEHNADEEDGGELTWHLDLESTEPRTLSARTSADSGSGFPWVLAIGGVVAVVALGGIAWDVSRRRRHAKAEAGLP